MTTTTTLRETDAKGPLELQNPHPIDCRIQFQEEGHYYYVDGELYNGKEWGGISSTTFLHNVFKPFDKEGVVNGILRNKRWRSDLNYKYYRMPKQEILDMWAANGKAASEAGTKMHMDIEFHMNGLPYTNDSIEFDQYLSFREDHPNLEPYRTEMMLFDEKHRITGSINALMRDTTDHRLVMVDWKRVKDIKRTGYRSSDMGLFPIENLPDANFWHYALQLNLHRNILQRCYGWTIKALCLVVCYPTQHKHNKVDLPLLEKEIEFLLEYRLLQLQKKRVSTTNTRPRCD